MFGRTTNSVHDLYLFKHLAAITIAVGLVQGDIISVIRSQDFEGMKCHSIELSR